MAERHTDDGRRKDDSTGETERQDGPTSASADGPTDGGNASSTAGGTKRRTFMKTVGAVAAFGGASTLMGRASAASFTPSPSGEVTVDPGEYTWDGSSLEIGSGDALVGGGSKGDVVVNLESGTMYGSVQGRLENIVVRGQNPQPQAGLDVHPGATIDGFVWPEGGQQDRDFCFYTPTGGSEGATIRNSAWAFMVNNGAYTDKMPMTFENCAAVNNNIAGIRVGHEEASGTTYVRNCLIAVTRDVPNDSTNSSNARGLRLRHSGHFVVENCYFVYRDVRGASNPIVFHDEAAGGTVEIRDCAFYNDAGGDLVRDKTGGEVDVTIEDCTVTGSGSSGIEPEYSGSGVSEDGSVSFPLPSQVTGYAAADEIEGVGEGIGPWDGSAQTVDQPSGDSSNSSSTSDDTTSTAADTTTDRSTTDNSTASTTTGDTPDWASGSCTPDDA